MPDLSRMGTAVGLSYAEIIHPEITKMMEAVESMVNGLADDGYDFANYPVTFDIPENYFDAAPRAWESHAVRLGINLVVHELKPENTDGHLLANLR